MLGLRVDLGRESLALGQTRALRWGIRVGDGGKKVALGRWE